MFIGYLVYVVDSSICLNLKKHQISSGW